MEELKREEEEEEEEGCKSHYYNHFHVPRLGLNGITTIYSTYLELSIFRLE